MPLSCEGLVRFTGLLLWTGCGGKADFLAFNFAIASVNGFCISNYRHWHTELCIGCTLLRWSCYIAELCIGCTLLRWSCYIALFP
jgi:hypothetical protein